MTVPADRPGPPTGPGLADRLPAAEHSVMHGQHRRRSAPYYRTYGGSRAPAAPGPLSRLVMRRGSFPAVAHGRQQLPVVIPALEMGEGGTPGQQVMALGPAASTQDPTTALVLL
jgi:hypothetical protein